MAFLNIQYFIFPESKMKVIPLVTPFAVPLSHLLTAAKKQKECQTIKSTHMKWSWNIWPC